MGDPKFSRRKYVTPSHPWKKERIEKENELIRKYGLKNKTELWKVSSLLRTFRKRARELQAKARYGDMQAEKEKEELLKRLNKIGVLGDEASLDDVLVLDAEILLGRRLQTMAYHKGLSNSPKQARQFIVHGHVSIGDRKITVPGYFVKRDEEDLINYLAKSPLANDLHPARPKEEGEEREGPAPPSEDAAEEKPTEGGAPAKPEGDKPTDKAEKKGDAPKEEPAAKEPAPEKPAEEPKKEEKPKVEEKPKEAEKPAPEEKKDDDKKTADEPEKAPEKKEAPPSDKTKEQPPSSDKTKEEA